ncbi:putative motility protein [Pseudomonas sp. A-1]|jgi:hypothetical protein|uniref:putative motility protein n=1 Tax=Pseudomonas sp. A-1 TaxID=1821274 RepID=UPI0010A64C8C|nr:putative motility protein [Pseudomonas sp. A-1]THG79297.1 putative motility protein [Pseudomonas sp. A-1]
MSISVEGMASAALAMQQQQLSQNIQTSVLKKALDAESSTTTQLLQSMPQLATEGTLGTRINTYA